MARTKFRPKRRPYLKEDTSFRRISIRRWKARCRQAARNHDWEAFPIPFKGTEGWDSW